MVRILKGVKTVFHFDWILFIIFWKSCTVFSGYDFYMLCSIFTTLRHFCSKNFNIFQLILFHFHRISQKSYSKFWIKKNSFIYFLKVCVAFRHFRRHALQRIDLFVCAPNPYTVWHGFVNRIYRHSVNTPLQSMESNKGQYQLSKKWKKIENISGYFILF